MHAAAATPFERIVIVTLDTLGDLVLRQPLFSALLDRGHEVTVVARKGQDELIPFLDRRLHTLTVDFNPHQPPDDHAWRELRGLADRVRTLGAPTIVAAAYNRTFADEWIARQFPQSRSFGFANPAKPASLLDPFPEHATGAHAGRGPIFDVDVECPPDAHEASKQGALFAALTGVEMEEPTPVIALPASELEPADELVRRLGVEPGRYVFGCPAGTATVALKAWPAEQFAEIAARIFDRHGLPTLLAGVQSEAPLLEAIAAAAAGRGVHLPVWIGGAGQIGMMLGLIAHSRAYLGNDSGPMHCAGALDVPVVARFGGGHWPRFVPLAKRAFTATQKLPCFGCAWQCWLDDPACLTGVDAETILAGFDWVLSGHAAERRIDLGVPLDERWAKLLGAAEQSTRRLKIAQRVDPARASAQAIPPSTRRPKVFVVTPSFNQALYLRATIDSVLAQDYDNLDYLVMDGGSTDGSLDILRSYGDRVRWVSGPDGGQAAAIARAWSETDADIVAWLNSDDTYLPDAVSKAVAFLDRSPDAAMVYGEAWHTDAAGRQLYPYPTRLFDRDALAGECFICQPATFIRRDVFKIVRMPDPGLRYCMDYDLWIRISRHFHIGQIGAFLATSRLHLANKSLGERSGLLREAMQVSEKHFGSLHPRWKVVYADHRMERVIGRLWPLPAPVRTLGARLIGDWTVGTVEAAPFEDGWARPRTLVPITCDQDGWMTIDADMPFWPYRRPLRITASIAGRVLASRRIAGPGTFAISVRVPPSAAPRGSLLLESSRWFFPFEVGRPADRRMLSFHILGVRKGRTSGADNEKRADQWSHQVARLRFMPAIVQRLVLRAYARFFDDPVEGSLYGDGWAGPRTAVDVGAGAGGEDPVVIECECPVWPFLKPLRITISAADGAAIKTHTVQQQGRFALTFRMPSRSAGNRVLLVANQSFVPLRLGFSDDSRVLSFRILDVSRMPAEASAAARH